MAFSGSLAAGLGAFSLSAPAIHRRERRIRQRALNDALGDHARWQEDPTRGRRANFAGRDLSGLDFGIDKATIESADFLGARLHPRIAARLQKRTAMNVEA
jgi:hypothetical protein